MAAIFVREGFMIRFLLIGVITCISGVVPGILAHSTERQPVSEIGQSFLQKAAEGHYAEVALGQLALQKASHDQVKQYGARMVQDHQKAGEEAGKLSSQAGRPLPTHLSMQHQQIQQKLSQLSGKDFDIAYISFLVGDHMRDLAELEQAAKTLTDPQVEQWTADNLPLIRDHLEQAKAIAVAIGVKENDVSKAKESAFP